MMRWVQHVLIILIVLSLFPSVLAHKSPLIEYGRAGVWRTEYTFIPRQPVVLDPITLQERVIHMNGTITGNVTMYFSVYEDRSTNPWYGGKQYKQLDWTLIHEGWGQPKGDNTFQTSFTVDQPGNYFVTVDLYEDGQYIGQDQRAVDVENRTIGPLYTAFSAIVIIGVLWGVRQKVL